MALLLRKQGITRIRPLQGGLNGWRQLGYPVYDGSAEVAPPQPAAAGSTALSPVGTLPK